MRQQHGVWACARREISLVLALIAAAAGCATDDLPQRWDLGAVQLPEDDGPHDCGLEWWYYSGHLAAESGERWGFLVAAFKFQDDLGGRYHLGNFAVTDHARNRFYYDERPWLGPASGDGYDLNIAGWKLGGENGHDRVVMDAGDYAVELEFEPLKAPVAHGIGGVIGGGQADAYYYSRTRLAVSGTLTRDSQPIQVDGTAWMDHQWFNETVALNDLRWDWFALQLGGSQELMIAISRAPGGEYAEGTWVDAAGKTTYLPDTDFTVTALSEWTSPVSGAVYPMGWHVTVPRMNLALDVQPTMVDQELRDLSATPAVYWEGEVEAIGTHAGNPIEGLGYVELTGYGP